MATSIPPHNAAEIIDAAVHLIDEPGAGDAALMAHVKGPGFPDRRQGRRRARRDRFGLCDRPRQLPRQGDLVDREGAAGLVDRDCPRNPVPGGQGQVDRADRPAHRRPQAADPRRRPRRIRRRDPHRHRAAQPHGRAGPADGQPVPPDRPRNAGAAQPQRARRHPHAAGDGPQPGADRMARLPDRGAGQPREPPAGEDRRPDRAARRLSDRLSEPRPGHPDHPHRGRAQAGDDRRVRAERPPGRGDPQHAPAELAQARGDADPQGAGRAGEGEGRARETGRISGAPAHPAQEGPRGRCASATAPRPRSAAAARWSRKPARPAKSRWKR